MNSELSLVDTTTMNILKGYSIHRWRTLQGGEKMNKRIMELLERYEGKDFLYDRIEEFAV